MTIFKGEVGEVGLNLNVGIMFTRRKCLVLLGGFICWGVVMAPMLASPISVILASLLHPWVIGLATMILWGPIIYH